MITMSQNKTFTAATDLEKLWAFTQSGENHQHYFKECSLHTSLYEFYHPVYLLYAKLTLRPRDNLQVDKFRQSILLATFG